MAPDLILCHGRILTMDPSRPEATAVAIRQGIIQAVGETDEILSRRGRATRIIQLFERTLVPGFIGTGLRLPDRRDVEGLACWIGSIARAGFTTVDVADLGEGWEDYFALSRVIECRHRLRLRGAIRDTLIESWPDGDLLPSHGNDLLCIEAIRLRPSDTTPQAMLARARRFRSAGWGVRFDCLDCSDLDCMREIALMASDNELAGMRVLLSAAIDEDLEQQLTAVGLQVARVWELGLTKNLSDSLSWVSPAMHLHTAGAAHLAGVADIAGRIRQGLYADFAVLNRAPSDLTGGTVEVIETWIEGIPVRPDESLSRSAFKHMC